MSSTNEELTQASKPRVSPLDFRNTDLVSRLLAATPPYLYNMPIVPNSYFFSEMLRSLVQAKTEASHRAPPNPPIHHPKRPRKRPWGQSRGEYYQKLHQHQQQQQTKVEKEQGWQEKLGEVVAERPLDLGEMQKPPLEVHHPHQEMMFPPGLNQDSNLLLPPPPPIWYPPLYPTPYGIDPLHFLIDLRVSGHIYDRKNQKERVTPPETLSVAPEEPAKETFPVIGAGEGFKQSKHASAFKVPVPSSMRHSPVNLSSSKDTPKNTRFDVKSMGFDKNPGKNTTNYVMSNISSIYKDLQESANRSENVVINVDDSTTINDSNGCNKPVDEEETEEEKQKKVKDLRALIGLELVVDYMSHSKPEQKGKTESSSRPVSNEDVLMSPESREAPAY